MKLICQRLTIRSIILGVMALLAALPQQTVAQGGIQVTDQAGDTSFRDQLIFTLSAENSAEITEVDLFYRVVGQLATSRNEAEFTPGTSIEAAFTIDQTNPSNYFPPGTELEYWWKIVDADGNELKTERKTLLYSDERHNWQALQDERLTLYWYEGSEKFGQALFDRANVALDTLESDIGIVLENPIKIFIYANHQDLLGALSVTAQEWTGGVAYTEFGVVVLGINPRQLDWGLNAMTHEMSHLVIHQATDNPFTGLPRWLDEGIAVYNENRDELDEDFRPLFERAVRNDTLITLRTLSSPFSADPLEANLAYGQSGAMVNFIVETYGSEAMADLLSIFAEGAIPDEALEQALGVDTDGLDNAFRASLTLAPLPGTEAIEIETTTEDTNSSEQEAAAVDDIDSEPAPESAESSDEAPALTEGETEAVPQPSSGGVSPEGAGSTESPLSFLPCLAGILALLIMGWGVHRNTV
jgi:hypothetical protein